MLEPHGPDYRPSTAFPTGGLAESFEGVSQDVSEVTTLLERTGAGTGEQ